jgi:plastocyanin domain-containing protein
MKSLILMSLIGIATSVVSAENNQNIEIQVTDSGFEPNSIDVKPNTHVYLKVTRKSPSECAEQIQIPDKKIKLDLPLNKTVSIDLGVLKKGEIRFGCGMNMMMAGQIHIK